MKTKLCIALLALSVMVGCSSLPVSDSEITAWKDRIESCQALLNSVETAMASVCGQVAEPGEPKFCPPFREGCRVAQSSIDLMRAILTAWASADPRDTDARAAFIAQLEAAQSKASVDLRRLANLQSVAGPPAAKAAK